MHLQYSQLSQDEEMAELKSLNQSINPYKNFQGQPKLLNHNSLGENPYEVRQEEKVKEVKHEVLYGDTLEGLSLEYDVPINKIRQRNAIDGDNIYHLKIIFIPNPKFIPLPKEKTQEMLIEEFTAHMNYSEKEKKVAKYYLSENKWSMDQALKEYLEDLQWQKRNKQFIITKPIQKGQELTQIRKHYNQSDLRNKKYN